MKSFNTQSPDISVLKIANTGSQLSILLLSKKGQQLHYTLQGALEFLSTGKPRPSVKDEITVIGAYGIAQLQTPIEVDSAPLQMAFQLAGPIRANLEGKAVIAEIELRWPNLANLTKHQIFIPDHPYFYAPVKATVQLHVLWQPGSLGVGVSFHGLISIPEIATVPLLTTGMFFCLCPPKKPKCKKICLDIKVGPRAGAAAVMTKEEVNLVIKRVNEIWGCEEPGQCCIEFTVKKKDIHLNPAGLNASVKVKEGKAHDEHKAAVNIQRSTTCYNVYYVEKMQAPPGKNYPGMALSDANASVLIQYPPNAGYTNETLATVTAHELGHALGLALGSGSDDTGVEKHSTKSTNVMHHTANLGTKLNADQCTQARKSPLLKDSDTDCESQPSE